MPSYPHLPVSPLPPVFLLTPDSLLYLTTTPSSLRAGINPVPTKRGGLSVVGAGFTPARIGR
jgi:hypothetical protein